MISATHFDEVTNGYERQTSGLWLHRGNLMAPTGFFDVGSLRVSKNLMPPGGYKGEGIEFLYAGDVGYIQSIDRDVGVSRPLSISGSPVTFPGGVNLPDGAATALIGAQIATAGWTTTTTGVWVSITPLDKVATGTGARLRIEFTVIIQHSVANAVGLLAVGWDNVAQIAVAYYCLPLANQPFTFSGTYYTTSNAGVRTYQMFAYQYTAGTLALSGGAYSRLYMVEERR